jgi:hypothetical protein
MMGSLPELHQVRSSGSDGVLDRRAGSQANGTQYIPIIRLGQSFPLASAIGADPAQRVSSPWTNLPCPLSLDVVQWPRLEWLCAGPRPSLGICTNRGCLSRAVFEREGIASMLARFSDSLSGISSGRTLLLSFLLFLIFPLFALPWLGRQVDLYSQPEEGYELLFVYTPDELYSSFERYGEQGRMVYTLGTATIDMVFPLASALFQGILISLLVRRVFPSRPGWQRLNLVPSGAALLDILENLGLLTLLLSYPGRLTGLAAIIAVVTVLKWTMVGLSFLTIVVPALGLVDRLLRRRKPV